MTSASSGAVSRTTYVLPPPPAMPEPPVADPLSMMLGDSLRDVILMGALSSERSLQVTIGASEIGGDCPRAQAYRARGVPSVNFPDPLRSLVGIGTHYALADIFRRADRRTGRYLVEQPLTYRGVPGTADLFDRQRHILIDWKTTLLKKLRIIAREGPPRRYVVQAQIYGAAFDAMGEHVERVALAYLATDGELKDLYLWHTAFDRAVADEAIDRFERLATAEPAAVPANPSRLCRWCNHYRPGSKDLSVACPGTTDQQQ